MKAISKFLLDSKPWSATLMSMDTTETPTAPTNPAPNRHERRRRAARNRRSIRALWKWGFGGRLTPRQHMMLDMVYAEVGKVSPHRDVENMVGATK